MKRRRFVVRRTMVLMTATALALVLAVGVAFAQPWGDQGPGITKACDRDCQGTTYPDDLIGADAPNRIHGLGGNESPTSGDLIQGHGGDDTLYGNAGGDRIEGGNGADTIYGGAGKDLLIGRTGRDRIYGGTGGDTIRVRDGYRDVVNCQGGSDNVTNRDSIDVLRRC